MLFRIPDYSFLLSRLASGHELGATHPPLGRLSLFHSCKRAKCMPRGRFYFAKPCSAKIREMGIIVWALLSFEKPRLQALERALAIVGLPYGIIVALSPFWGEVQAVPSKS